MLILDKAVFLMIPRTGTTWVRQALRNAGLRYKEWGPKHCIGPWRDDRNGGTPGFKFTFVREPAAWLKSRWALGPWEDELKPYWTPDPEEFCAKVSPAMVEMYYSKWTSLCSANATGHTETIADDLVRILTQCGEKFNERGLRATKPTNESGPGCRLTREAFYDLKEEQWCQLPVEDILNMPTDLLRWLPDAGWDRLDVKQSRQISRRLAGEASPPLPRTTTLYLGNTA